MSYFNRYKTVEIGLPTVHSGYEGWITFETFKAVEFPKGSGVAFEIAGTRRRRAHFKNIITIQGFDQLAQFGDIMNEVAVGTGNVPESVNDTTLVAFVAGIATTTSDTFTAEATPPHFGSKTNTWRFGEGVAEGILAEAGIGRGNTNINGSDLWSRALIKDGAGDPTTVEVTENEWLDVTYQLRCYPGDLDDSSGSFLIQPSGDSHDFVLRNTRVTSGSIWGAYLASIFPVNNGSGIGKVYEATSVLQDVTSEPTDGSEDLVGRVAVGSYTPGSFTQSANWSLGLSQGNVTGGIAAMTFHTNVSSVQMSVDPVIAKDNLTVFDFTVNWEWGTRVVIP
jgi:hypothetical protein